MAVGLNSWGLSYHLRVATVRHSHYSRERWRLSKKGWGQIIPTWRSAFIGLAEVYHFEAVTTRRSRFTGVC